MAEEPKELDQLETNTDDGAITVDVIDTGAATTTTTATGGTYAPETIVSTSDEKEIEDEVILAALSKKLGKELKSFDDMAVEKVVEKPLSYASEQVASIDKFIRETGRTVNDWYETQSVDYNTLPPEQIIKDSIRKNSPDLTNSEVNLIFENEYHLDSEEYEEREVAMAQAKLKMRAGELRKELINTQNKYKLPAERNTELKPTTEQSDKTPVQNLNVDKILEYKKKWVETRNAEVEALENIKIGQFDVNVNEDIKESIKKANSNLETFFPDHFVKDGKWDSERLNTFIYLAQPGVLEKVIGNVASSLVAEGKESIIKERKNLDMGGIPTSKGSEMSPEQQAELEEFKKAMVNSLS